MVVEEHADDEFGCDWGDSIKWEEDEDETTDADCGWNDVDDVDVDVDDDDAAVAVVDVCNNCSFSWLVAEYLYT